MSYDISTILLFFVTCVFSNNIIFARFLGNCPFLGVSNKVGTAAGMGIAVTFVIGLSSAITWVVYHLLLVPLGLDYLYNISFILVIAALVQFVEMVMKKTTPALYEALGIYLPLITTNCAVLGIAVVNINESYDFGYSVLNGVFSSLGFLLAIVLMAGVRERLEASDVPAALKGLPLTLVSAGLMAVAFLGFSGLFQ